MKLLASLFFGIALASCGAEGESEVSTSPIHSAEQEVSLTQAEIKGMIAIFDRIGVPVEGDSVHTVQKLKITSTVKSFNPARWEVHVEGRVPVLLTNKEVITVLNIFDRVEVPVFNLDPITLRSEATIYSRVSGFNPARWTVGYEPR